MQEDEIDRMKTKVRFLGHLLKRENILKWKIIFTNEDPSRHSKQTLDRSQSDCETHNILDPVGPTFHLKLQFIELLLPDYLWQTNLGIWIFWIFILIYSINFQWMQSDEKKF